MQNNMVFLEVGKWAGIAYQDNSEINTDECENWLLLLLKNRKRVMYCCGTYKRKKFYKNT